MVQIRMAEERDAEGIRDVLRSVYGDDYAYPEYYDVTFLKKFIFSDNALVLVAEVGGGVVGTGSVVLESGAYTDLVGEFGRLAVHPDWQGQGIGNALMKARVDRVKGRLHVGFVEARTVHTRAMAIAFRYGFAPVGLLPLNLQFGDHRESTAYMVHYFGPALALRRNNPRIIPEVLPLAGAALDAVGLERDYILDETEPPLPYPEGLSYEEMTDEGYAALLRIERGRLLHRDVFGPMRLQYGFFRLQARNSEYIIARRGPDIVGALGFIHDADERTARVFEMIHVEDEVVRGLLAELEDECRGHLKVAYIEIDVNAHTPGVQRTLLELGYIPVAYVPAMAFHRVERIDVVKMVRLLVEPAFGHMEILPAVEGLASVVLRDVTRQGILPRLSGALASAELMDGLSPEQAHRLAGICEAAEFAAGEVVFAQGDEAARAFLLLEGEVEIEVEGRGVVGEVGAGETLGEVALLTGSEHSATARARGPVAAVSFGRRELFDLVRRRPDVGVVLYRNLARGLGSKLRRADRRVPR